MGKESVDYLILAQLRVILEGKCSQHGFVIPMSLEILSRSMGQLEHGRYTGNVVFHVQLQGKVYNPANGTQISGVIEKKNKMGLYIIYNDAVRILVPRDLHIGSERFESLQPGETISIEIRKSRFQIQDAFILSIGVLVESIGSVPVPVKNTVFVPENINTDVVEESEEEDEENDEPLLGNLELDA